MKHNRMRMDMLPVESIVVPPDSVRERPSKVDDDVLAKSIKTGGIQQPLVVLADGEHYRLVKGSRRLAIARAMGLPKVPCVIDSVPEGQDVESYARKIRFILDEHRQDLVPSQKAELIVKLKAGLGIGNAQVAAYLGVDADSITNWLAVRRYVPAVVAALDSGRLTMQAARVFDGMSEDGQRIVWKKHERELVGKGRGNAHKRIRLLYPPEQCPGLYRDAQLVATRLARTQVKRKAKPRESYTAEEKRRLLNSVEMKEAELEELKDESAQLKREITAAMPIVSALLRNKAISKLISQPMREELERFAEVYC